MLQQESCDQVPKLPLEILVAQTQGQIGYMIESTLDGALMEIGVDFKPLVTLITYVVVDKNDPAFAEPTKPIGPVFTREQAAGLAFPTRMTPKGLRRVVASPEPVTIIEKREIKRLIQSGFIVICCGGGGIPVIRNQRAFTGVDAVIDKDLASALLAREVGADLLVIATDVDGVMANFGKPDQGLIRHLSPENARQMLKQDDTLGKGSMAPKLEAAVRFCETTGSRCMITGLSGIVEAVRGKAGTRIE